MTLKSKKDFLAIWGCDAYFNSELQKIYILINQKNLCTKFLAQILTVWVSYFLLSRSLPYVGLEFMYSFKTHYYVIGRLWRYTLISQVAAPMLSHVTWAMLKLLVVSTWIRSTKMHCQRTQRAHEITYIAQIYAASLRFLAAKIKLRRRHW